MQATFLLGPAGSGKTHRCLAEISEELLRSPEGLPLILLAPKQATFQLERQLLANPALPGYTRLQILSFERLAGFVLSGFSALPHSLLDEEGRVMVLRSLLAQKQEELKIFRAAARLPGFAQQLSLLLREFQRHQHPPEKLLALAGELSSSPHLADKLSDLGLLLRAYADWLKAHKLQDANRLPDLAAGALRSQPALPARQSQVRFGGLWLDGFAEMTPQELGFLAALAPFCERTTLAFCLESEPRSDLPWLSTWSVVGRSFQDCYQQLALLPDSNVKVEILERRADRGRFTNNSVLAHLERHWARPKPYETGPIPSPAEVGRETSSSPRKSLRVAICQRPEAEAVLAAREIMRYVRSGGRYRDCAVLLRTLEGYGDVVRRVFQRYDIPVFLDRRESVAHHPLSELTRYMVRLAVFGWEHDDWFGALKTGLITSDEAVIDRLENEALARGWKGSTWLQRVQIPGDPELEASINRWLENILPPIHRWVDAVRGRDGRLTGRQLATALHDLWRALEVENRMDAWGWEVDLRADLPRSIHTTVFEQLTGWLDNVELAFSDERLALAEWLPLLEAGLASLTVGVIPPALDQVLVGTIDRSRNPDLKLSVLPGWNEGVFPAKPSASALLTEPERKALTLHNLRLGPDQRHQLGHERYYGYIACTRACKRVVITCSARDSADSPLNPSLFIGHLQRLFPGLEPEAVPAEMDWCEAEHGAELMAPLLSGPTRGKSGAARHAIPSSASRLLERLPAFEALLQTKRQLAASQAVTTLPPPLADLLFGKELRTSVSALEDFAACPFKFFSARGLRAEERREFEADPRARGDFQHKILEEFHREVERTGRRWRDLSGPEARDLIGRLGEQLLPAYRDGLFLADDARRFTARMLIVGAQRLIEALVAWMPQYRFDPSFAEVTFGLGDDGLPAWRIELARGHALMLRGRIDRIDLCRPDKPAATLAVVIDYKSRPRSLDAVKLQHGLELQLLSYLGVLRHLKGGDNPLDLPALRPVGAFYVGLKPRQGSSPTRNEARTNSGPASRSGFQHSGRFDADWLGYFDNRDETKGDQFKYAVKQDGSRAKRGGDALETADFRDLLNDVQDHLRRTGNSIYDGNTSVAPFRKGTETACDFCEFRAICRFDPWVHGYNVLRPVQTHAAGQSRNADIA